MRKIGMLLYKQYLFSYEMFSVVSKSIIEIRKQCVTLTLKFTLFTLFLISKPALHLQAVFQKKTDSRFVSLGCSGLTKQIKSQV